MQRTTFAAGLVLAALVVATAAGAATAHTRANGGKQTVFAYYVADDGRALGLEVEERTLAARTKGVARAAVAESLEAPRTPGLVTLAPSGTQVRGVNLRDRVLTIDLSRHVRTNPGVGAAGEAMFAQQLAHAAGYYDGIDAVRLWVEGRPVTELWGHVDWSQPVRPDAAVVRH